jgi:ATP-dependent Clp protease protease subunit
MRKKLLQLLADNRGTQGRAFKIVQLAGSREATIYLYDTIVSDQFEADYFGGVTAQSLVPQIDGLAVDTIHVRINSPGGDVFAGQAIGAALERHSARVIAHIDGLAASAATAIACSCDEVLMAEGAMYMIHRAWTIAMGDCNDFMETAALLEKVDGTLASCYAEFTGKPVAEISKMMDAETWFTAEEALAAGFANALDGAPEETAEAAAAWNLAAFANAPKARAARAAPKPSDAEVAARKRFASMKARQPA